MPYYDVFLAPVSNDKRADYESFLDPMHKMFLELGASEVIDLWGDDVPDGKVTSLPMSVQLKEGETVAAGYVVWPSKEVRDAGWGKMMSDDTPMEMPFDGKRIIFGGFSELLRSTG